MAAVAVQVLHQDVSAVRLEADAVVAIIDDAILDHDVAAAVRVPAVGVLSRVVALAVPGDGDVAEHDVAAVGYEVVVLWAVAQVEVGDAAAVEADGAEKDGAQDVDVRGVEVVPNLPVAVDGTAAVDVDVVSA